MTQELINLRTFIQEGRYADALIIVDKLEGMSKQAILRNIEAYLRILLIHLIKNQGKLRLTILGLLLFVIHLKKSRNSISKTIKNPIISI